MAQSTPYRKAKSGKSSLLTRGRMVVRIAAAAAIALAAGAAVDVNAQIIEPVPFPTAVAGVAPGGSATACSTTVDIPTFNVAPGPFHNGDGCVATQATLSAPYTATVDSLGNIYIGDYSHFELRVVYNGGAALATAIEDANPSLTFVPQPGHIYDIVGGSREAAITKTGSPSAYYCNGLGTSTVAIASNGDGCPGTEAYVKPRTPAVDKDGNIFFSSIAGGALVRVFYVQGSAAAALITLENPGVTPQPGFVYTIAGSATNGYSGDNPAPPNDTSAPGTLAKGAQLYSIRDVIVDANENVYISDGNSTSSPPATNNNIRKVSSTTGAITTLAGSAGCTEVVTTSTGAGCAFGTTGASDGDGGPATGATTTTGATFDSPFALFLDANANVYVADYYNARIRVIYQGTGSILGISNPQTGYVYTVVGSLAGSGATSAASLSASGTPATSLAFGILSVAGMDAAGNIYVYDGTNRYIWRIDGKTGIGVIIGGLGASGTAATKGNYCAGSSGLKSTDTLGDGCPATQASFAATGRFSFDAQGNLYETDSTNAVIRELSLDTQFPATAVGTPITQSIAFTNAAASADYTAENFSLEGGATTEFSDAGSDTCSLNTTIAANTTCVFNVQFSPRQAGLRKGSVALTGSAVSSFLGGVGQAADSTIDPGTQTVIGTGLKPNGVGTDLLGNLYIADATSNTVKKVAAAGGTPATLISGLNNPAQIAVDGKGNVYVADTGNNRIAMTSSAGGTITALGTGLSAPTGVAVDALGNVYVADKGNNRVVEINAIGGQQTLPLLGLSALNAPSRLALDSAGDLYVADTGNSRVVEFPVNGSPSAVNLGTTSFVPSAVAVDAAGDLYITDATNLQVVDYLAGSTNGNPLITGLTAPVGIAVDVNGSVYVADTGAAGAIALNRTLGSITYPVTNLGQVSPAPLTFTDTGNLPLIFTGTQFATATGNTTQFSLAAATTNGCGLGSGNAITAGGSCLLTANFAPTVTGNYSETLSPVTNAANNSSLSASLSGQAVLLIVTTTTAGITAPTTPTIAYGQSVTISSTTTLASNGGTPTGTITFTVDGRAQTPIAYGTGTASITLTNLAVGSHAVSVSVAFTGYVYASSSSSVNFTVSKAVTTTTLTSVPTTSGAAVGTLFTATVASTTATGETGTVNFYSGTTLLNASPIAVSGGVATYPTTQVIFPSNNFSAVYSGDTNFSGSTGTLQPTGTFNLTAGSTLVSIPQGGNTTNTIVVTPYFGYSGTVTPVCSNLPQYTLCGYQPVNALISGTTPVSFTIFIYTNQNLTSQNRRSREATQLAWALLSPLGLAALVFARRRGLMGRSTLLALALAISLLSVAGLAGCSRGIATTSGVTTPAGTQAVTVTFTDNNSPQTKQSINFNLDVIANP